MTQKYIAGFRPAIAMIELIFAITIMGIALMSVPNLLTVSSKSGIVTLQQEAISEASAHISAIMTYAWDEHDTNDSFLPPILNVNDGDSELDEYGNSGRRLGTPIESYRKFITSGGFSLDASDTLGKDPDDTENDDIDDFNNEETGLIVIEEAENDYVDRNISMLTNVLYMDDSADYNSNSFTFNPFNLKNDTTNIKLIKVTLTSKSGVSELSKEIVLRAFSCNIGSYHLERKRF